MTKAVRTATLNIRIDPEVKKGAMAVCDEIGISMSSAVNMMLKYVSREGRLPDGVVAPKSHGAVDVSNLSDQQIVDMINERIGDNNPDNYHPIDELFAKYNWERK